MRERTKSRFCILCHDDTIRLAESGIGFRQVKADGTPTGFRICNKDYQTNGNEWTADMVGILSGLLPMSDWWNRPYVGS